MNNVIDKKAILHKLDVFFHSPYYVLLVTLIGIVGLFLHLEVLTIFVLLAIMAFSWLVTEDILPSFMIVASIGVVALRIPRDGLVAFEPLYVAPFFVVPAFIAKLFIHRFKFIKGYFFYPTLAVSVAITIGGIFSMSVDDYLHLETMYYMFFLGIGMVFIYFIIERYVVPPKGMANYFSYMMLGVGLLSTAMLGIGYYDKYYDVESWIARTQFQWGNNLTNNLLLTMPFAFYLGLKHKFKFLYILAGSAQFMALMFSTSRGGVIFGLVMFPIIVITTFVLYKGIKEKGLFVLILVIEALTIYIGFEYFTESFDAIYQEIVAQINVSSTEARAELYRLAWDNFLEHPIFGVGIGFDTSPFYSPKTMSMYWYHSTFFQVIGSMGLIGVFAYTYQEVARLYQLIKVKHLFNLFVFLSLTGFSAYSMVNIGYFSPLPLVAMLITMFVVVERHNDSLKEYS